MNGRDELIDRLRAEVDRDPVATEEVWQEIRRRSDRPEIDPVPERTAVRPRIRVLVAGAAAALLAVTGVWFLTGRPAESDRAPIRTASELVPSSNSGATVPFTVENDGTCTRGFDADGDETMRAMLGILKDGSERFPPGFRLGIHRSGGSLEGGECVVMVEVYGVPPRQHFEIEQLLEVHLGGRFRAVATDTEIASGFTYDGDDGSTGRVHLLGEPEDG